jgi:hypothetical protein
MAASAGAVQLLNKATELMHPELYRMGLAGLTELCKDTKTASLAREWPSIFTGCAIIVNRLTKAHRDYQAEPSWYDLLVSLGNFQFAKLELPELGLELDYPPGTAVAFYGNIFTHLVDEWGDGDRLCYAFFMRRGVLSRLGQNGGDWVPEGLYDL